MKRLWSQEHSGAMVNLSFMYYWGKGVKKDRQKAFELNLRSAQLDNAKGQYNLARDYEDGTGVPKDYKQADLLVLQIG